MNITKHALERMAERGFTPEMLAVLMKGGAVRRAHRDEEALGTSR